MPNIKSDDPIWQHIYHGDLHSVSGHIDAKPELLTSSSEASIHPEGIFFKTTHAYRTTLHAVSANLSEKGYNKAFSGTAVLLTFIASLPLGLTLGSALLTRLVYDHGKFAIEQGTTSPDYTSYGEQCYRYVTKGMTILEYALVCYDIAIVKEIVMRHPDRKACITLLNRFLTLSTPLKPDEVVESDLGKKLSFENHQAVTQLARTPGLKETSYVFQNVATFRNQVSDLLTRIDILPHTKPHTEQVQALRTEITWLETSHNSKLSDLNTIIAGLEKQLSENEEIYTNTLEAFEAEKTKTAESEAQRKALENEIDGLRASHATESETLSKEIRHLHDVIKTLKTDHIAELKRLRTKHSTSLKGSTELFRHRHSQRTTEGNAAAGRPSQRPSASGSA